MNQSVQDVLFEMVDLCDRFRLEYVILGGIAVRVHGIPRPTFDVDLELSVSEQQLTNFFQAASQRNYEIDQPFQTGWRDEVGGMPLVKLKTFLAAGQSVDVDIFLNETEFQQSLMQRRQQIEFENRQLNFVTPEDLVLLKLLANRPRDLSDVADILFVQSELDQPYLQQWADRLGIADQLTNALAEES